MAKCRRSFPGTLSRGSLRQGWARHPQLGPVSLPVSGPSSSVPTPPSEPRERAGWRAKVSPGVSPPSFRTPDTGEIFSPGHGDSDFRIRRGERRRRGRERDLEAPLSSPGFTPGPVPAPGAAGYALCRRENPERWIGALAGYSSAVWPPSWACSVRPVRRRPPTRKLALPGRGRGRRQRRGGVPAAPRQPQTSPRPRRSLGRY